MYSRLAVHALALSALAAADSGGPRYRPRTHGATSREAEASDVARADAKRARRAARRLAEAGGEGRRGS